MGKLPVFGQQGGETLRHVAACRISKSISDQAEPDGYTSVNLTVWLPADVEITESNFKLYVSRGSWYDSQLPNGDQSYYLSSMEYAELGKTELLLSQYALGYTSAWKLKFAAQAPVISDNYTSTLTSSSGRGWGLERGKEESRTLRNVTLTIQMKYWIDVAGGSSTTTVRTTIPLQLRIFE